MATNVGASPATSTANVDIHSITRRYNRILMEILKSQSSGVSQVMPFDVVRILSYIAAMTAYQAFVVAQPLLDCPETGPMDIPLPPSPVIPYIENESGYDIMQLIEIARDELTNSQSARLPTNMIKFDYARQQGYLGKISALVGYIGVSEPLDLPESSPMDAVTGHGARGV